MPLSAFQYVFGVSSSPFLARYCHTECFRFFDLPLMCFLTLLLLRFRCRQRLLVFHRSKWRYLSRNPSRTPLMAFLVSTRYVRDRFRAFQTSRSSSARVLIFIATGRSWPNVYPP